MTRLSQYLTTGIIDYQLHSYLRKSDEFFSSNSIFIEKGLNPLVIDDYIGVIVFLFISQLICSLILLIEFILKIIVKHFYFRYDQGQPTKGGSRRDNFWLRPQGGIGGGTFSKMADQKCSLVDIRQKTYKKCLTHTLILGIIFANPSELR